MTSVTSRSDPPPWAKKISALEERRHAVSEKFLLSHSSSTGSCAAAQPIVRKVARRSHE